MAQSDDGNLVKALHLLSNGHLIIANELQDMAIAHEPYEHFISVSEDTRRTWRQASEILKAIGDRSEGAVSKEIDMQKILDQQKIDDEQIKLVIGELRMMAEGVGRYSGFKGASEWTRNVWYAAAEMLEQRSDRLLH